MMLSYKIISGLKLALQLNPYSADLSAPSSKVMDWLLSRRNHSEKLIKHTGNHIQLNYRVSFNTLGQNY